VLFRRKLNILVDFLGRPAASAPAHQIKNSCLLLRCCLWPASIAALSHVRGVILVPPGAEPAVRGDETALLMMLCGLVWALTKEKRAHERGRAAIIQHGHPRCLPASVDGFKCKRRPGGWPEADSFSDKRCDSLALPLQHMSADAVSPADRASSHTPSANPFMPSTTRPASWAASRLTFVTTTP
jgi:hypothetical protein